jgi:cytidine deaminase
MSDVAADVLLTAARKAALAAYSPYSKFRVGAAALFAESGNIYTGCNVENSSFGLTICAERVAICKAASNNHRQLIKIAIAVVDEHGMPKKSFMPCGACLQFMQEFARPDLEISVDGAGSFSLQQLLPLPF